MCKIFIEHFWVLCILACLWINWNHPNAFSNFCLQIRCVASGCISFLDDDILYVGHFAIKCCVSYIAMLYQLLCYIVLANLLSNVSYFVMQCSLICYVVQSTFLCCVNYYFAMLCYLHYYVVLSNFLCCVSYIAMLCSYLAILCQLLFSIVSATLLSCVSYFSLLCQMFCFVVLANLM